MSETIIIPGDVVLTFYEGSRIKDTALINQQNTYVKVKHNGKKARTDSILGGTAPTWGEDEKNVIRMPVEDINADVHVEVWRESKNRPNAKIASVSVPVEPYARTKGPPTPRWHKLNGQGSLLFSVSFEPYLKAKEIYDKLDAIPTKRAKDPTTIDHEEKYHSHDDHDEIQYGDEITLHAMGLRWMKYGTCLRTYFQHAKKSLQLTQDFDEKNCKFIIFGSDKGNVLTYGSKFNLLRKKQNKKLMIGTGMFAFLPVGMDKKMNDAIKYGDAIYLQAYYPKTGAHTLGCAGESRHVFDSTLYINPHTPKVTFTINYSDCLLKKKNIPPATKLSFKLTTYNVWMMPDKITAFADVSPNKCERAQLIPDALPECDVVIFNEAFCHIARPVLLEAMKEKGFYFETPVVGHLVGHVQSKFLDGGVVVVSKYPILETDTMRFGSVCHGDDALADKGVVYACILKDERKVHVFASHTQAWTYETAVKIRQDQFRMIRNFVDEKDIPSNEPVIVAGDFNVNKLLNDENNEYTEMCEILECNDPEADPEQTTEASFDADHNPLSASGPSSDGVCERLDFILTCKHHKIPSIATTKIIPIQSKITWTWGKKGEFRDLSDHYPLTSNFEFNY